MFKKLSSLIGCRIQRTVLALLMAAGMWGSCITCVAEAPQEVFNVGLSPHIFPDVRSSDTIATIKTWGHEIFTGRGMNIVTLAVCYDDTAEVEKALREETTDCVAVLAEEYFDLEEYLDPEKLVFYSQQGRLTTEYLLLVRADSSLETLASLKGKTISVSEPNMRMLGWKWLEILLMEENSESCKDHFGSISVQAKESRAVLNLFFGKTEACLTTRSTFETMTELNPQIGKTLRPILVSPGFIPSFMCLSKAYDSPEIEKVYDSIIAIEQSEKIKQMLVVFGVDQMVTGSVDHLETSRRWLERYVRLKEERGALEIRTARAGE